MREYILIKLDKMVVCPTVCLCSFLGPGFVSAASHCSLPGQSLSEDGTRDLYKVLFLRRASTYLIEVGVSLSNKQSSHRARYATPDPFPMDHSLREY